MLAAGIHQRISNWAFVKRNWPAYRYLPQGVGQIHLNKSFAGRPRLAFMQKYCGYIRLFSKGFDGSIHNGHIAIVQNKALVGQFNCRSHHLFAFHCAIILQKGIQAKN